MILPRYIAAIIVQKTSGLLVKSMEPGSTLCILSPASIMALGAAKGIPRVSRGIIEPITALLLAASGAMTPSAAPCPNFSGVLDIFFSSEWEANAEITVQGPGKNPT